MAWWLEIVPERHGDSHSQKRCNHASRDARMARIARRGGGCPTALGDWAVPASPFALCGSSGKARRLAASLNRHCRHCGPTLQYADPHFTAQTHLTRSTHSRHGPLKPKRRSPARLSAYPLPPPARACLFGRPPPCSSREPRSSEGASLGKCESHPLNCNSDL